MGLMGRPAPRCPTAGTEGPLCGPSVRPPEAVCGALQANSLHEAPLERTDLALSPQIAALPQMQQQSCSQRGQQQPPKAKKF